MRPKKRPPVSQSENNSVNVSVEAGNNAPATSNGDPARRCQQHAAIEVRVAALEGAMSALRAELKKLAETVGSPKVLIAIISLIGTAMATLGSIVGTLITVYAKSKGYL